MKTKYFLRAVTIVMAVAFCCAFFSCGPDGTLPDFPNPFPEEEPTGEVTFEIKQENSNGEGEDNGNGIDSPAVVQTGDTLEMAVSQTSSYTDPDGSVFTCEPKASIKLSALGDTLYVKDFQTLTTVKEISQVASETTSGEKLTKQTLQTFDVGGKEVVFDLAYDIFNHINSLEQSIEMPYIKINSANFGTAKTEETKGSASAVVVKGMRITPHTPQTRGTIVDSTAYDVNVAFNLEIESVNTKETQNQTLSFEVEFLAVVRSVTEYPDPEMYFSYQLQILGGTNSTSSPFRLNLGETMHLQWVENSQYSYFSLDDRTSQTISHDPKAFVKLFAGNDTLWVTNEGELEQFEASDAVITEEGTSPLIITGQKTFSMAGKDITFNWGYETYDSLNAEGANVAVPHLELSEPQIISVNAVEQTSATIPGKTARVYEVTVRFSQQLKTVNIPEEHVETIEYVVKYIGAFEVKLVKVVYRKGWEWVDSHDNIMLAYYPIVYRDRIYSTGETFTDTFNGGGYLANMRMDFLFAGDFIENVSDGQVIRKRGYAYGEDSIAIVAFSASVPDLSRVYNVYRPDFQSVSKYISSPPGTWEEYETAKLYSNQDLSLGNVEVIGADSLSEKVSGWYFYSPDYCYEAVALNYGDELRLLWGGFRIGFYDAYLSIDGRMINFLAFRGPMQFETHKEDITMPNGAPGIVYTSEFRRTFLSKNFYACRIDSVYQQEP